LAEPNAAVQALTAWQTYERLGAPEGELALAQEAIFLGTVLKSNAAYSAFKVARKNSKGNGSVAPEIHILNASTTLMDELGYSADYQYDHDAEDGFSGQNYLPESVGRVMLYQLMKRGFEGELRKRLDYWQRLPKKITPREVANFDESITILCSS
jgi:putative ATPase